MSDRVLNTAERMALAVLQGDLEAARLLADHLLQEAGWQGSAKELPPVRFLKVGGDGCRLQAIAYIKDGVTSSVEHADRLKGHLAQWLRGDAELQNMVLAGVDRVEVYELPPAADVTRPDPEVFQGPLERERRQRRQLEQAVRAALDRGEIGPPQLMPIGMDTFNPCSEIPLPLNQPGFTVDNRPLVILRRRTGLPLQECRRLLEDAGGDLEAAIRLARDRHTPVGMMDADGGPWGSHPAHAEGVQALADQLGNTARRVACPNCGGAGTLANVSGNRLCPTCRGSGRVD